VGGDQCLEARLPARVVAQLPGQRRELDVERVDHRQRDGDLIACGHRERLSGGSLTAGGGHQVALVRAAVVVEHRLELLLPLGALMAQRVPPADLGAEIEDVTRRDPRLRQPANRKQLG
jgi:hypothetical protein